MEKQDGKVMQALKGSGLTVPEFGPTNMGGNRWFDQMAFTETGKQTRKTRLLRHGTFDWRHAVFGPHPKEDPLPIPPHYAAEGIHRLEMDSYLNHYEDKVNEIRKAYKKKPYKNWSRSYRNWTTFEMSDHLPIWMELEVDYSNDYLKGYL